MVAKSSNELQYEADDLVHLEGLDAVRKRPGMYIGSTGSRGINHLFNEIVDNSTDEAGAGYATKIVTTLHSDGSIEVSDNGRGIPTGVNAKSGVSGLELVLTKLHAGGKFGGAGYKTTGGLHGVGASAVNALSLRMDATVAQNGVVQQISFQHGTPGVFDGDGPSAKFVKKSGLRVLRKMKRGEATGTSIRYWYDSRYFENGAKLSVEELRAKIRNTAFLVPNVTYELNNQLQGEQLLNEEGQPVTNEVFCFPNGPTDMIDFLTPDTFKPIIAPITITGKGTYKENAADENGVMQSNVERECEVEISLQWNTGYDTIIECFTNTIRNVHGGKHKVGFDRALTRTLTDAITNTRGLLKPKEDTPVTDDVLEGMTAVIHVKAPEPQFTSQTKDELSTVGVTRVVQTVVEKHIKEWLENRKTKSDARLVLQKIVDASRVRTVQKQQKDTARRKTALEGATMPAKLVDCRTTGVDRSELFLVEGDSALGSARKGRSSEYQALLPLRGKVLNVQKASLADAFKNVEIESIIQVIGAGSGRTFELEKMRYNRVILMADADVDGSHIRCLLITLFAKYLRPVIESGRLYAAMPPLHKIVVKGKNARTVFTYTQEEMERTVAAIEKGGETIVSPVPRFKGLGEMNAVELWDTTMDPARRSIRRITMNDVAAAEAMVELCMGDNVPARRDFIIENANKVEDIDA